MSKFCVALSAPGSLAVAAILTWSLGAVAASLAQSGSTLTPDRLSYVVSKDVGAERWTINLNLATSSPQRTINVTGNVFRSGQAPSFVWCQERADSSGTLSAPSSVFRLRCSGSSACGDTATGCARSQWTTIADLVEIPARFFLPPGGQGFASGRPTIAPADAAATASAAPTWRLSATPSLTMPGPVRPSGTEDRGANLPPDGANFLVNKELGGLRWSISLNQIPAQRGDGATPSCTGDALECIVTSRFLNVTGNVYPLDGSAPQFVWCQEQQGSTGDLNDPNSEFLFGCVGAGPCTRSASECAIDGWQAIPGGSEVRLRASFFLPPGGLPSVPQTDPEIVVIGRTSDPPSLLVPLGSAVLSAPDGLATAAGGCSEGASCMTSAGGCASVQGRVVSDARLGCACLVDDLPPACITCGTGATGQCGGDCQYQIGGATARGQCLPFSSTSSDCACYAADQGDQVAISICGGALGNECPTGRCCADDVRDGCDPASGDVGCAGICVDANGCDPTVSSCGLCLDQRGQEPLFCGEGVAPNGASCCDCPDGSQSCYCDPGRSCVDTSEGAACCPTSLPDLCDDAFCVPAGADCCIDCPPGLDSCYCAAGSVCGLESDGGECCPLESPVRCGADCLPAGTDCCANLSSCPPGSLCDAASECAPDSGDDCGDGYSCSAGYQCVDTELGCCLTELTCGTSCLTGGEDCCGDGSFCEAGLVCAGGPGDGCCPADLPVACGDSCFAPGTVCDSAVRTATPAIALQAAQSRSEVPWAVWSAATALPRHGMRPRVPGSLRSIAPPHLR